MRTLPTICVHKCNVLQVSLHASNGRSGHCELSLIGLTPRSLLITPREQSARWPQNSNSPLVHEQAHSNTAVCSLLTPTATPSVAELGHVSALFDHPLNLLS